MKRLALLVVLLCAWLLGCGTPRDNAVRVANSAASFMDTAEVMLAKRYDRELTGCVERAETKLESSTCRAKVKRRFAVAWASHESARHSWLLLAATIEAADAGGSAPDPLELAKLLGRLAKSLEAFKRIAGNATEPASAPVTSSSSARPTARAPAETATATPAAASAAPTAADGGEGGS